MNFNQAIEALGLSWGVSNQTFSFRLFPSVTGGKLRSIVGKDAYSAKMYYRLVLSQAPENCRLFQGSDGVVWVEKPLIDDEDTLVEFLAGGAQLQAEDEFVKAVTNSYDGRVTVQTTKLAAAMPSGFGGA